MNQELWREKLAEFGVDDPQELEQIERELLSSYKASAGGAHLLSPHPQPMLSYLKEAGLFDYGPCDGPGHSSCKILCGKLTQYGEREGRKLLFGSLDEQLLSKALRRLFTIPPRALSYFFSAAHSNREIADSTFHTLNAQLMNELNVCDAASSSFPRPEVLPPFEHLEALKRCFDDLGLGMRVKLGEHLTSGWQARPTYRLTPEGLNLLEWFVSNVGMKDDERHLQEALVDELCLLEILTLWDGGRSKITQPDLDSLAIDSRFNEATSRQIARLAELGFINRHSLPAIVLVDLKECMALREKTMTEIGVKAAAWWNAWPTGYEREQLEAKLMSLTESEQAPLRLEDLSASAQGRELQFPWKSTA